MTLREYTFFVANYTKFNLDRLGFELQRLLGCQFPKFAELLKKVGNDVFFLRTIQHNQQLFLSTFAEFCEPLLVKSEEEKGGQDAAKA